MEANVVVIRNAPCLNSFHVYIWHENKTIMELRLIRDTPNPGRSFCKPKLNLAEISPAQPEHEICANFFFKRL
ncbi:hypothetical protein AC578_7469 [Pseudocercospora eumusae]|uniref:Uncharacterized protein n=1 Tax=Pseudocercospora eumusae TaxID=321146 RepID=A0A139H942_9PEZI|nr:hypothetical protein AC578_7469 [Pseudocercospora eumusae]